MHYKFNLFIFNLLSNKINNKLKLNLSDDLANKLVSEMVVTYNSRIMYDKDTFLYETNEIKTE